MIDTRTHPLPDYCLDPPEDWGEDWLDAMGEEWPDDPAEREALYQAWIERQADAYYDQIDREIDACREAELFGDR
jgi:hypothetical protein